MNEEYNNLKKLLTEQPPRWQYYVKRLSNQYLENELMDLGRSGWEVVNMTLVDYKKREFHEDRNLEPRFWQVTLKRSWAWILQDMESQINNKDE